MLVLAGWLLSCGDPSGGTSFGDSAAATQPGPTAGPETTGGIEQGSTAADGESTDADSGPPSGTSGGSESGSPEVCLGEESAEVTLSAIWIANSQQNTISKIDTQTLQELGRYRTHPGAGDPSRTSVDLNGDVAVANRNGGVAKFWASPDDCVESNGTPGLQTSTGGQDILEWRADECLAWFTELDCDSNRPVAWTRGTFDMGECRYVGAKLWTACDGDVLRLDGDTGEIEDVVEVGTGRYLYGAAADADGNLWALDTSDERALLRVDFEDLEVSVWPAPEILPYGITVGPRGRPWLCAGGVVARFDARTGTYAINGPNADQPAPLPLGGCMTDGEDTIWLSNPFSSQLLGYDLETLQQVSQIQLPEHAHGISVDFDGFVWGVSMGETSAYRVDPQTEMIQTFTGLVGAYTYSDMTGFALSHAGPAVPTG